MQILGFGGVGGVRSGGGIPLGGGVWGSGDRAHIYTHRIHGAAIYSNMDPINIPQMLAYIPAPWIRHGIYTPEGNHLEKSVAMSLRFRPCSTSKNRTIQAGPWALKNWENGPSYHFSIFFLELSCHIKLLGGIPTPLKNMKVRLDHHPNYWEK